MQNPYLLCQEDTNQVLYLIGRLCLGYVFVPRSQPSTQNEWVVAFILVLLRLHFVAFCEQLAI